MYVCVCELCRYLVCFTGPLSRLGALGWLDERALRNAKEEYFPLETQCGKDTAAGKGWSGNDSPEESWSRKTYHGGDNAGGYGKDSAEVGTACYHSLIQQSHDTSALYQGENQ